MSVTENGIDFNSFEEEIFGYCHRLGCEIIKTQFEKWDTALMPERNHTVYRHKGQRKTVLKTMTGEVEYSRAIYEKKNDDGTKSFVYLLAEAMDIHGSGFMSGLLSGHIAEAVCSSTYRDAAQAISNMTGQKISHQAAWNVAQQLGESVGKREEHAAVLAAKDKGSGKLESKIFFQEADGIWLHMQGDSRKKHGSSHK